MVRGPDLLWDERIEDFAAPAGRFDGIIGGPPCQNYSDANRRRDEREGDRLVLEFLRLVEQARPRWWLIENCRRIPTVGSNYCNTQRISVTDWEFGGCSERLRHIQFGHQDGHIIRPRRVTTRRPVTLRPTLTTAKEGGGDTHARRCERMGVTGLVLAALTKAARRVVMGNGVPWGVGTALADAVKCAGPVTDRDCTCGCGREVTGRGTLATVACRQRSSRRARGRGRVLCYRCDPAAE